MNKHTPGPWETRKEDWGGRAPRWSVGRPETGKHHSLARVLAPANSPGEAESNARLIAAAPDMLAALKALNMAPDRIVAAQGGDIIIRFPMEAITAAAAAVAKAEAA